MSFKNMFMAPLATFALLVGACDDIDTESRDLDVGDQSEEIQTQEELEDALALEDEAVKDEAVKDEAVKDEAVNETERPITNAPHPVAEAPCGIYVPPVAHPPGQTPTYYYTIRNCHNYTVYRISKFQNGTTGSCRQYSPNETYSGSNYGRYPVDLIGC